MTMVSREPQFDPNMGFLRDIQTYFDNECEDMIPSNFTQAESLHFLFMGVQQELQSFLRRYLYTVFWVRARDIEVTIIPGIDDRDRAVGFRRNYKKPSMRISLSRLSFLFDSEPVQERLLQDFTTTKKFDMKAFLEGHFFGSFEGHPLKDFLHNSIYLAEMAAVLNDGKIGFLSRDVIDSMKEELVKYDTGRVEVPDYSLNPFDFLEMNY